MRNTFARWLALVILALVPLAPRHLPAQEPPFEWQAATAESQGMSSAKLSAMQAGLAEHKTKALLIVRNDRIVLEWYAEDHSATKTHYTASMAKALVGGVSVAVAITDGRLALNDPASKYIPAWRDDAQKRGITIAQLGSHASGLDDADQEGVPHEKLPGWMGEFWRREPPPGDPFTISRDRAPLRFDPGTGFHYSNPGIAMLSYATTAALESAPEKDLRTVLRDRVMRPIGVPDKEWSVGYGQTVTVGGLPLVAAWGGGGFTARAAARVGRLMLREGDWHGKQLISRDAVQQTTSDAGTPGPCGIGWWTNNDGHLAGIPRDAYWAAGAGDQFLLVVPSLKLIAVRNGAALPGREPGKEHEPIRKLLFEPLVASITEGASPAPGKTGRSPYPASRHLTGVVWSPAESIVRHAPGSDNWPLTWADDGHLYGAYGDGWGFEREGMPKLSLGLARIEGEPGELRGVNIRSESLEQKGDDVRGKKASGLLCLDGVLYLWARNAGNSQLAWSSDHGRTWTWSDWKFTTSFGCPTVLNFGQDYAGARDEFVYLYSHDADSAYVAADRMVLARVSKAKLRERQAYEFFAGLDRIGEPLWTSEIGRRAAVFEHPTHCYRSTLSYHAASRRYLWCQILPGDDPRFRGGLAIYDAPEPWGPWTSVFYNEAWDVGPGETCSLPTKWMKDGGRTLHLVFSGEDHFSVRKLTVELTGDAQR
ncbi:MAG: serine hydrolase [Planctomycetaceae bacterium]|nr:serine hydrolase [Planctomycetaceae bacterium]